MLLDAGQTRAAITHYAYCTELLRKELDLAPPAAMTRLIETASLTPLTVYQPLLLQPPVIQQQLAHAPHNLSVPHDQFFGRIAVQHDIGTRLDQPWCRLVTFVGQGGVGKTRLATTVARSRLQHYPDGTWLVELAALDRSDADLAEAIAVEIATVLDRRLSGSATLIEQTARLPAT